ncbi:MAG: helix-turn-helix domain-containing protein [Sphingobacteriales bacterium]|nr:MAG: helix-turn-helix domain-containing protein [Sphingobacteriales bacterium]
MSLKHQTSVKPDPQLIELVINHLSSHYPFPPELRATLVDELFFIEAKKGDYLLEQGETSKHFYFIAKGIIIGYTTRRNKKLTTYICIDGDTVSSISGMFGECPSEESIYVVEDSHLLCLRTEILLQWLERSFAMNVIIRKILESFYKTAHERSTLVRMGTAEDKYNYFLATAPNHADRVPLAYIADYLDIQPKTLHKLLKERAKEDEALILQRCALIDRHMAETQAFKQQGLTLSNFAEAVYIPAHELSHLLNVHYQKGFNAFVNEHRVNYIKHKLKYGSDWRHLKIEALGIEGGFSSRSSFFSEFKNHVGISPAEYAKIQQKSSPAL